MRSLLFALGVLVGCSSGGDEAIADPACTEWAAAWCDKTTSCRGWYVHAVWGDASTCRERVKAKCLANLGAPSTSRTAASTRACADATKLVSCGDFLDEKLPEACVPKAGGLAEGKPCGDGAQCTSGFCNRRDMPCGVCAPKPGAGADCTYGCASGLQCSESGKCATTVAIGAGCSADVPCTFGSTCVSGVCAKDLPEGASCDDTTAACDTVVDSLSCTSGKCTKIVNADLGATCGVVGGFVYCAKSGTCAGYDPTHGVLTGTCVAPAADGAPCGGTKPGCLPLANCNDGVCKLPDPAACR